MTISAILPVYNGGQLLAGAIASILNQSRPLEEILLVDDGSTDGAAAAFSDFHSSIRYIRQENAGCSAARNTALKQVTTEWVTFLDADDYWSADAVLAHIRCLQANPEAQIIAGHTQVMRLTATGEFENTAYRRQLLSLSSMLFRRDVFSSVGLFAENLRRSGDFDWFVRAQEARIPIKWHDHVTLFYQHHPSGLTGDTSVQRSSQIEVIRNALNRKRASAAVSE